MNTFGPKIKSGALQMAIYVSVLVALLLSGLILYAYTFLYVRQHSEMGANNIALADSGIAYLLEHKDDNGDTIALDFHQTENQKLQVCASTWGVFRKAFARARFRGKTFDKCALFGAEINPSESPTLYLQDFDKPLSIVGKAKLKGNIFLPRLGVKPGYIMGRGYENEQLVYGKTAQSLANLPELDKALLGALRDPHPLNKIAGIDKIPLSVKSYTRKFSEPTAVLYYAGAIDLQHVVLVGNIVVESDSLVRISASARLEDVIVRAPHIVLESGTNGRFQAIASVLLQVGEKVELEYPSALALCRFNESAEKASMLSIGKGSKVSGVVLCSVPAKPHSYDIQMQVSEGAVIQGSVFCNNNLELKGTVYGSVYAAQFICKAGGTIYVNHILDGSVQNTQLPQSFSGILMEKSKQSVAQWLY